MKRYSAGIAVMGFFFCANAQIMKEPGGYVDTIKGRVDIKYNNPSRFTFGVLVGAGGETQGTSGGKFYPQGFVDVQFRPIKRLLLIGNFTYESHAQWEFQKISDALTYQAGIRYFITNTEIKKTKVFTVGNKQFNYDFFFPVKVRWNVGLAADYRTGSGVFNSGTDSRTSIRFNSPETGVIFIAQAAVPYTFSEVSAGFVVSTTSRAKVNAYLPTGVMKSRRMKSFTEFSLQGIYGTNFQHATTIDRMDFRRATYYSHYEVIVQESKNWGFKVAGTFRRKLIGLKIEAGVRPGIESRFADSEKPSFLDRSYLKFGLGFGWM